VMFAKYPSDFFDGGTGSATLTFRRLAMLAGEDLVDERAGSVEAGALEAVVVHVVPDGLALDASLLFHGLRVLDRKREAHGVVGLLGHEATRVQVFSKLLYLWTINHPILLRGRAAGRCAWRPASGAGS
jgi:hypothetical protein